MNPVWTFWYTTFACYGDQQCGWNGGRLYVISHSAGGYYWPLWPCSYTYIIDRYDPIAICNVIGNINLTWSKCRHGHDVYSGIARGGQGGHPPQASVARGHQRGQSIHNVYYCMIGQLGQKFVCFTLGAKYPRYIIATLIKYANVQSHFHLMIYSLPQHHTLDLLQTNWCLHANWNVTGPRDSSEKNLCLFNPE